MDAIPACARPRAECRSLVRLVRRRDGTCGIGAGGEIVYPVILDAVHVLLELRQRAGQHVDRWRGSVRRRRRHRLLGARRYLPRLGEECAGAVIQRWRLERQPFLRIERFQPVRGRRRRRLVRLAAVGRPLWSSQEKDG
jgi:hypothetical protein